MDAHSFTPLAPTTAVPAPGFSDPVGDAQACFRAVMRAFAAPGVVQSVNCAELKPPAPLTPMAAAIALTLLDYDTPVWLDPPLAGSGAAAAYLRFHTGAPVVELPMDAAFALISDPFRMPALGSFSSGSTEYPDRSATVILMNASFDSQAQVTLSGPGIKTERRFSAQPLAQAFWAQAQENNALYPRGVDILFANGMGVAGLPRSTRIHIKEG